MPQKMTQTCVMRLACTLSVVLLAVSSVQSQNTNPGGSARQVIDQHSGQTPEAIIVREEAASGRAFDPAFRAQIKADLASLSSEALVAVEARGFGLLPSPNISGNKAPGLMSPNPFILGQSSSADLVFNPVPPCRIIDTRLAGGPVTATSPRNFFAAGINFSSQGGFAGDCGVPFGPATAVAVNLVAVGPAGGGDLRAFPFPAAAPLASVLNYANVPGLNIANGINLMICDTTVSTCSFDFTVQVDGSATDLVADVMGYFAKPVASALDVITVDSTISVPAGANGNAQANCPAGRIVTGGGCFVGIFTSPLVLVGVNPNGNGWNCGVHNGGSFADTVTSRASCGRVPGR